MSGSTDPYRHAFRFDPPVDREIVGRVEEVKAALAPGVVARDRAGSAPLEEAAILRRSGLAALTVDDGQPFFRKAPDRRQAIAARWQAALFAIREISRVDLSAAALIGYNYMHLLRIEIAGRGSVFERAVADSLERPTLWGGANNPGGPAARLERVKDGYVANGSKSFATAAQTADRLVVGESCRAADGTEERLTFVLDAAAPGISHADDWDGIGARRSASGRLLFENVFIPADAVFSTAPADPTKRSLNESIGSLAFQIMFVNFLTGIAFGSIDTALAYLRSRDKGGERALSGYVAERAGQAIAEANAAFALASVANAAFAELVADIDAGRLTAEKRGEIADLISQAKVASDAAALSVTSRIFEAVGARGATLACGLDRYWRDARTYTLHDPVAVKAQEIGRFGVHLELATPSANS
ncbi:MAG: acyl-CoA dehydrogenase family protein [Mesorhizobium sp.]